MVKIKIGFDYNYSQTLFLFGKTVNQMSFIAEKSVNLWQKKETKFNLN
jgi:hypothetical protein